MHLVQLEVHFALKTEGIGMDGYWYISIVSIEKEGSQIKLEVYFLKFGENFLPSRLLVNLKVKYDYKSTHHG